MVGWQVRKIHDSIIVYTTKLYLVHILECCEVEQSQLKMK